MKRGDIVRVALQGDYGKPRPALVVQADIAPQHPSVVVLPITSMLLDAPLWRITLEATPANGLRERSQIMLDKPATVPRKRVGAPIGRLDETTLGQIGRTLAIWLGLA